MFCLSDDSPVHGDDIKYIFKTAFESIQPVKFGRERKVSERMCSIMVSFAQNGDPNNPKIGSARWLPMGRPAIDTATGDPLYTVYDISDVLQQIPLPEAERMHFWDYLYAMHDCRTY